MPKPCYCGKHLLDPEHATYVKDGHPMCHERTCAPTHQQATTLDAQLTDMRRRELAARMIGAGFNGR